MKYHHYAIRPHLGDPQRCHNGWIVRVYDFLNNLVATGQGKTRDEAYQQAQTYREQLLEKENETARRTKSKFTSKPWTRRSIFPKRPDDSAGAVGVTPSLA
jgi:hypothetical protein